MAAITADGRQELVALYLTMFGRAPTTLELSKMVVAREGGSTVFQVAATLALEDNFALVASKDADSFATYLADALLASDIPAAARAWAIDWVVTQVSGTKSKAQVIAEAVQAIRATTNVNYASSQAELTSDVTASLTIIDNPVPGELTFTLTDEADTFNGGIGPDKVSGLLSNLESGDVVKLGGGDDTITLTADASSGIAEVDSANISLKMIATSTIDATLFTNVDTIGIASGSITGTNLTVAGASYGTTYAIDAAGKNNNLTLTFLDGSGTADTAKLALSGTGIKSSLGVITDTDVTFSGNVTEAATISTTGTNYVDLIAGTNLKTLTITGSGNNYIDVETSNAALTVDASAATGLIDLDMGTGLSAADVLKAGAGTTDKLTATIGSTTSNDPTISGFETLALTLSSAVNFDMAHVTGATTVTLADSSVSQRLSNVPVSVTAVSLAETTTAGTNNVRIDYVKDADATLALNFAPAALPATAATTNVAWGDVTVSNVKDLTLSASGAFASTIGDVAAGNAARTLTVKTSATTGDFTTGEIVARDLESVSIEAVKGDVTVDEITNANKTLESFKINASGGAAVTVTSALDAYDAGDETTALSVISIIGGDESVIKTSTITAGGAATDDGADTEITISLGDDSDTSSIGAITVIGVSSLGVTLAENAGTVAVGLVKAEAADIGDITLSIGDDAFLDWDGATADEGDIGDVSITTVVGGTVSANGTGTTDTTITSTKGDIGDVTVSTGNGGDVDLAFVATAGSVGDVKVTSMADDEIYVTAADTIGSFTGTTTAGDIFTTVIDAPTIGNISITGAGSGSVEVKATTGTATTGNITVSLTTTTAVDSTVNLSDVGSAGTVSVTTGAGADTIVGTAGADTLNGGSGADGITGGDGGDIITVGSGSDADVDTVTYTDGDTVTGVLATGFTVATGMDQIKGLANGDKIDVGITGQARAAAAITVSASVFATAVADTMVIVSGSYSSTTGIFTAGAASTTNNDYVLQFTGGATTTTINSVLLIDIVGTVTAASDAGQIITLTVA